MVEKYLVTGANGFIAMHVVDQLLKQGHQVRGTIRNLNDQEKVESLKKLGPVEIVQADLLDEESLRQATKGIDIIIHVASPVVVNSDDEDECIKPALAGTKAILKAALEENVKRVVITSSTVTVIPFEQQSRSYSDTDWIDVESVPKAVYSGYQKSKILAEKTAWEFYEEHKKKGKCFELSTILPSITFGPILNASNRTSISIIVNMFENKDQIIDGLVYPVCDVRDVALAHLRAAQLDEAVGKRFIIVSEPRPVPMSRAADILREAGYKVANFNTPEILDAQIDDSNMRNILKIEPIDFKKSVLDLARSLFEFQVVKN